MKSDVQALVEAYTKVIREFNIPDEEIDDVSVFTDEELDYLEYIMNAIDDEEKSDSVLAVISNRGTPRDYTDTINLLLHAQQVAGKSVVPILDRGAERSVEVAKELTKRILPKLYKGREEAEQYGQP